MNELRKILNNKFAKEIAVYESNANKILDNNDFVENINMLCNILESEKNLEENFPTEKKRTIFVNMYPNISLKMLWFAAISQDNLEIYKFTYDGLKWKKGFEIRKAIECQEIYLEEFKPPIISNWLVNDNHFDASKVAFSLGSSLLYCFEKSTKRNLHQLVNCRMDSTNSEKIYDFLKYTENKDLFHKIMKNNMKNFGIFGNNIILKQSNLQNQEKFYSWLYKNTKVEKIDTAIESFKKFEYNNIASYFLQKKISENLPEIKQPPKKFKI